MDYIELTPFDWDLARMAASLTGKDCKPLVQDNNTYLLALDFTDFPDKNYRKAVCDALEGKAGKRFVEIRHKTEFIYLAKILKSDEKLPRFFSGEIKGKRGQPEVGKEYCRIIEKVRALQFNRNGVGRLIRFVGNGEMEVPERGYATFHFLNASGSVWEHAMEGDYIVYLRPGHYEVMSAQTFERQFE